MAQTLDIGISVHGHHLEGDQTEPIPAEMNAALGQTLNMVAWNGSSVLQ